MMHNAAQIIARAQYQEIAKVLSSFSGTYAVIKGAPLSLLIYKDVMKRPLGDIDLLVPKGQLDQLTEALRVHGFFCKYENREDEILSLLFSHQTKPYVKNTPGSPTYVDLNFDIFWGEYTGKRISIELFLDDTIEVNVHNTIVRTLSPIKALIQLILHHYKEMNSIYLLYKRNSINYRMFEDVYFLIKNNRDTISRQSLYELAEAYEIIPYIFYVLYFTNQIYKDQDLQKYVDMFNTADGLALLDYYGLAPGERKCWSVDFCTRLECENMYELIKDDLTKSDYAKILRNARIFE